MTTNMIEQAKAMAERSIMLADIGDMGRKPDPTCFYRKNAALIRQLIAQIEGDQNAGSGIAKP